MPINKLNNEIIRNMETENDDDEDVEEHSKL